MKKNYSRFAGQNKIIFAVLLMAMSFSAKGQWILDTVLSTGYQSSGIAITSDGGKIVVSLYKDTGSVLVISTSNYATLGTITDLLTYPDGIAVRPGYNSAIVNGLNEPIFINASAYSAGVTYPSPCVATTLYGVAITPDGTSAVIPNLSSGCVGQGLSIYDASGTTTTSTFIPVSTTGELYGIAITPDGSSAVVTNFSTAGPQVVNLSTSAVQNVPGMGDSYGVAVTHSTNDAVVTSDSVHIISLATNSITATINFQSNSDFQNVAVTADDKYAFVVGSFDIAVISLTADTIVETLSATGVSVATMPDGSKFFVTDSYNGTVRVYKNAALESVSNVEKNNPDVIVYPNPANDMLTINTGNNVYNSFAICNSMGELILQQQINAAKTPIAIGVSVKSLPAGVYYITLKGESGVAVRKFVKM